MTQSYSIIENDFCQELFKKLIPKQNFKVGNFPTIEKAARLAGKQDNYIINLKNCGTLLGIDATGRIRRSNFCKSRICPICQWKKSINTFSKNMRIVRHIGEEKNYIMITLTIENCQVGYLRETLEKMSYAFKKLHQLKAWKQAYEGYVKTMEVTFNDEMKTFHPHMHIICLTRDNYFDKDTGIYISQKEMSEMWNKYFKQNYMITDMRKVRARDNEGIAGAVAEISKYALKMSKAFQNDDERVVAELITATDGVRMTSTGGRIKEVAKELKIDLEKDDYDDNTGGEDLTYYEFIGGKYIRKN